MDRMYLDHAATTPCRPEVTEVMVEWLTSEFGNPSSLHGLGRRARQGVESARSTIAACLNCGAREVVFTSGGSEANNLALRGVLTGAAPPRRHIVTTRIEHHSVLNCCKALEVDGVDITSLEVDRFGRVFPEQVVDALRPETILVSVMHANNEIGTIQPIADIVRAVKSRRPELLVHTDAVQSVGHVGVDFGELGVDLLSFSAHKFYGPKGTGGLIVREGIHLPPQVAGGGQESGLRSGTENVAGIVGMARALELACREIPGESSRWTPMRDKIIRGLIENVADSRLNGHPVQRLPGNINISFLGISGEDLVLRLDRAGIATSTGSACTTGSIAPSHVLTALGLPRPWAIGSCRLTLGHHCRKLATDEIIETLKKQIGELRSLSYQPRQAARYPVRHA